MALPHAKLLDVIDVTPVSPAVPHDVSTSLIKTDRLQLLHLVLQANHEVPLHHVADESTVHCLQGQAELVCPDAVRPLRAGQLVVLPAGQAHALRTPDKAVVLVSLLLKDGDAGDHGGSGGGGQP